MNWRRCGRSSSPVCVRRPLVFEHRGDGVSRRWRRVDGVYVGSAANHPWARGSAVGSAVSSDERAATRERPRRVFRDPTHKRTPSTPHAIDAKNTTRNTAPTHRRRSLFQELAKKFSECGSAKKGGDLGMFRRGKMSAAFELAAFNLDVHELSKTVASSSGVHLIYRVA